jgi:hypothetical protein
VKLDKIRCKDFSEDVNWPQRLSHAVQKFFDDYEKVEILAQTQSQNDKTITLVITFRGTLKNPDK